MEKKTVQVGIFWAVPDEIFGQEIVEFHKSYDIAEKNSAGFVCYPYSHFEMWDGVKGLGRDCYRFPRGRVIYDANNSCHLIYADECVSGKIIDEVVSLYQIERYELKRDEHYVCPKCRARDRKEGAALEYNILRGRDKIGENLIEIVYGSTKILVELGRALEGNDGMFEQEILQRQYSAVVVSHYHEDHAGLIKYKRDCPVYIGHGARKIVQAMLDYHGETLPENVKSYRNGRPFKVGGIKITPILCDHSAFDSYMLLFEAGGKSILYTGDFRFHGRKGGEKLLAPLPEEVDVLIHEGTNLGKNSPTMSEEALEESALAAMRETENPVFVLQSGTNLDRLVSIYRASKRSGRLLYMDNYTALIAGAAGGSIPRPDVFEDIIAFTPRPVFGRRRDMFFEIENKRRLKGIAGGTRRFTMLVRPSMLGYIKKLFACAGWKGATLIYSIWRGYKEREDVKAFLSELKALGVNIFDLHTSGHASQADIEALKKRVNAAQTVCVHAEI